MIRELKVKSIAAIATALLICAGVSGSAQMSTFAAKEAQSAADGQGDEDMDMSSYRERLGEIAKEQAEIDKQLDEAQENLDKEAEIQKTLSKKINSVNEEIKVSENYIDDLDKKIASQQELVEKTGAEITQGVKDFKGRLRAMYLAGSEGYTDIILSSGDFFDVLMRTELVKRVADHDKNELDRLVALKSDYEQQKEELDAKQEEYKEQLDSLSDKKNTLDELYKQSLAAQEDTEELKEKLEKQNKILSSEKSSYADKLSEFLNDDYGDSADETGRMKTELAAAKKLRELWTATPSADDKKTDEKTESKGSCAYVFGWPCPSTKTVTSGVGPRWGTTHKGLDIGAEMGSEIVASEGGKVVISCNDCTHNYGKDGSCGCGGGYGNYVVIDHGNGFLTLYGHLTEAKVKVGDKVDKGELIGISGTTGWSTGPHLHFELRYGGNYMNPLSFVTY